MELTDIEGLAAAELKKRRDELVAEAAKAPVEQLAARYVQARTDATRRDEKMAEQGETIVHLQKALKAAEKRAAEQAASLGKAEAAIHQDADRFAALQAEAAELRQEATAAKALATKRRAALADVMGFAGKLGEKVAPLLAEETTKPTKTTKTTKA